MQKFFQDMKIVVISEYMFLRFGIIILIVSHQQIPKNDFVLRHQ